MNPDLGPYCLHYRLSITVCKLTTEQTTIVIIGGKRLNPGLKIDLNVEFSLDGDMKHLTLDQKK